MKVLLSLLLLFTAGAAWADPPLKTVYQSGSTTKFTWQWPYHTYQTKTTYQYQPSPANSGYRQITQANVNEDLSNYRFHNSHLTYQNQWGYFFPAGTRPVHVGSWSTFITPAH